MIRVTIENVPDGREIAAQTVGIMKIDLKDNQKRMDWRDYSYIIDDNPEQSGSVNNHWQSNSIWKLIWKILEQEYAPY